MKHPSVTWENSVVLSRKNRSFRKHNKEKSNGRVRGFVQGTVHTRKSPAMRSFELRLLPMHTPRAHSAGTNWTNFRRQHPDLNICRCNSETVSCQLQDVVPATSPLPVPGKAGLLPCLFDVRADADEHQVCMLCLHALYVFMNVVCACMFVFVFVWTCGLLTDCVCMHVGLLLFACMNNYICIVLAHTRCSHEPIFIVGLFRVAVWDSFHCCYVSRCLW